MKTVALFTLAALVAAPYSALAEDSYNYNSDTHKQLREDRRDTRATIRNERSSDMRGRVDTRRDAVKERVNDRRALRGAGTSEPALKP